MKIKKILIKNFRLLSNFEIDLEDNLSLIIGKNNTGKTSFLCLLEKFLKTNNNTFSFDDFNLNFQKEIKMSINSIISKNTYKDLKMTLKIHIEYTEKDSLENISKLILNLEPSDRILIISFEYVLNYENFKNLQKDYNEYKKKVADKDILYFLKKNHKHYFKISKKVLESGNEENFIDLDDKDINKIISFKTISAKRDVSNEDGDTQKSNKTLSKLSYKYFNSKNTPNLTDITDLQKQLMKTDSNLNKNYKTLFKPIIDNVKKFGFNKEEYSLEIVSSLEEINILKENTSVMYNQNGNILPEDYNGLGYMNLFAIIFTIHILLGEFKKENSKLEKPADINLLYIEEPEAHTHPQMQYVFIKNIKNMLINESKGNINLQTIISTHSSHIVSQSEFNDIKYFYREPNNSVIAKNLSDLKGLYGTEQKNFEFLKKYLTLNRSELFFADKAIFIEGATERILLPSMMKKLDIENLSNPKYTPLLSQNISIIEVGAYSHVFDKFLSFLNIKTLIITDLDSVKNNKDGKKVACPVVEGTTTSNESIKYFLGNKKFSTLKNLSHKSKILTMKNDKWEKSIHGQLCIAYQTNENGYNARSFEDSFISLNLDFIKSNSVNFESLKNISKLDSTDYYYIANNCINKKTMFALNILYFSNEDYSDWMTPNYIKEGLLWIAK